MAASPSGLSLKILGPLRVWRDGVELDPGPRQQAYLLALLIARAGQPISGEELIDLVWDDDAPASARNVLHKYVGALRRLLEPGLPARSAGSYLLRRGHGYLFAAGADELDVVSFRELVRKAGALVAGQRDEAALDCYVDALRHWRGSAGAGQAHGSHAMPIFAGLDAEFADACVAATELAVVLGQAERVLTALRLAAATAPLHEPVHAALMSALEAAGQQADALTVFEKMRARLAEHLGINPGPALRAAHRRVLRRAAPLARRPGGRRTTITTADGTEIFYKDWGSGRPIVFSHGWPLSSDDWDAQMLFFLQQGYRVIAHDRRGHGRSEQVADGHDMDHYADDLAALTAHLDLRDAVHVGHSTGGGEVARYVGRHGESRVAKAVFISAVTPSMRQTTGNPDGRPPGACLRAGLAANRAQFFRDVAAGPFYGFNRPGSEPSEAVIQNWWRQGMAGAANAQYDCIDAFADEDYTEDLKKITVPVLVMHGDDDQIVPYAGTAPRTAELVQNGTLKTYPGFPHGMPTTHAETINADLLAFITS